MYEGGLFRLLLLLTATVQCRVGFLVEEVDDDDMDTESAWDGG